MSATLSCQWYNSRVNKFSNNVFISKEAPKMGGAVDFWYDPDTNILHYRNPETNTWVEVSSSDTDHTEATTDVHGIVDTSELVTNSSLEDAFDEYSGSLEDIFLTQNDAETTYLSKTQGATTYVVENVGFNYAFTGVADTTLPTITLIRGNTYIFDVSSVQTSHPFALRLSNGSSSTVPGATNNDAVNGRTGSSDDTKIVYKVPLDAPSSIVYQCVFHSGMIGTINIGDPITAQEVSSSYVSDSELTTTLSTTLADYLTESEAASAYLTLSNASSTYLTQASAANTYDTREQSMTIALSDEVSILTGGSAKVSIRSPFGIVLTKNPRASVSVSSSTSDISVDIKINGVSIFSTGTLLWIDQAETSSLTASKTPVLSTTSIADDAPISFDVSYSGSSAKGLKVTLYYRKA